MYVNYTMDEWFFYLLNLTKLNINRWCMNAHTSLCNYFMYNQIRLVSGIVNTALFSKALTSFIYVLCTYMERCFLLLFLCNRCYEIEIMWQEFCFTINKVSVLKSSLLCPWQKLYLLCLVTIFLILSKQCLC